MFISSQSSRDIEDAELQGTSNCHLLSSLDKSGGNYECRVRSALLSSKRKLSLTRSISKARQTGSLEYLFDFFSHSVSTHHIWISVAALELHMRKCFNVQPLRGELLTRSFQEQPPPRPA